MLPSDWLVWCRYDTAVTRDLWAALTKASTKGLDVAAMMDTWTLQVNIGLLLVGWLEFWAVIDQLV